MTDLRQAVNAPTHLREGGPGGASISVERSLGGLGSFLGIRNSFRGRAEIRSPYRESGWVHACLKPIGQAVAQVPLEFWTAPPELDKKARRFDPSHRLPQLFRSPSPLHTQAQFFEACAINTKLDGMNVWYLTDVTGQPLAPPINADNPLDAQLELGVPAFIVPIRGRAVSYRCNELGWPIEYQISLAGGGTKTVDPRSLVIFREYDPDNPMGGLSDVDAALSDIDMSWQMDRYQRALLENSGDPGGWIQVEGSLAQPEERALKNEAKEEFRVDKAGQWRVLTGQNVKYTPNKLTPRDMQYLEGQKWCRDKIAAILGVPGPIIGVLEHATLANVEQLIRLFWLGGNGVLAYIKSVEDVINGHFLPRLRKGRDIPDTVCARFNISGVRELQENKQALIESAIKLATSNLGVSIHEALKLVGLETDPLKHGDVALVSTSVAPVEDVIAGDVGGGGGDVAPEETPGDGDATADDPKDDAQQDDAADDAEKALATRDTSAPEDEGFKARTQYWETREAQYARGGRAAVKAKYLKWRKTKHDAPQLKRLRDFAKSGETALRGAMKDAGPVFDPSNLPPDAVDPLLLDLAKLRSTLRDALDAPLREVFEDAANDMAEELKITPLPMEDSRVVAVLERQAIKLANDHTGTLAEQVRRVLLEGLSEATSPGTLQQLVLEVLPELEDDLKSAFSDRENRANTIARTEVGEAASTARDMEMREAGVEETEWISSRDAAVRGTPGGPYADSEFSHYELDGKTARVGAEFDAEKHPGLKHPHDSNAAAGDTINCRCYARPVRKEE